MELSLPSQSYQTRSKPLSSQRLVNLYCEVYADDNGVLRTKSLIGTPGLIEGIDFELSTPIYGATFFKNKIIFCIKNKVFSYDKNIEVKEITVSNWEDFVQPSLSSNTSYGVLKDSKNSNYSYMITKAEELKNGVYEDEQNVMINTLPSYFVKTTDIPYVITWELPKNIKIKNLSIKTRLLPQNYFTARFYLNKDCTLPLGDSFDNKENDGIADIIITGIPSEGIETNCICLKIESLEENANSNSKVILSNFEDYVLTETSFGGSNIFPTNTSNFVSINNKWIGGIQTGVSTTTTGSGMLYYFSEDNGKTWQEKYISEALGYGCRGFASNNNIAILLGNKSSSSSLSAGTYFTTIDGVNWIKRVLPNPTISSTTVTAYNTAEISYVNGYFVISCTATVSSKYYAFGFYSTDGINWTQMTSTPSTTTSSLKTKASLHGYSYSQQDGYYYYVANTNTNSINKTSNIASYNTSFSRTYYSPGWLPYGTFVTSLNRLLVYGEGGVAYSDDGAVTLLPSKLTDMAVTKIIEQHNCLFAITDGSVLYKSTDNGINWETYSKESYLDAKILNEDTINFVGNYYSAEAEFKILNETIPYIKLERLLIEGDIQGKPITSYIKQYEEIGKFEDLNNFVDMATDGDNLFLLHTNGKGYYLNLDSEGKIKFNEVKNDLDKGNEYQELKSICYLAGRFIGVDKKTGTIRWTEVLDPNGWNALNYIQSETSIDELTAIRSNTREAWVFSPTNIEVYTPTGSNDSTTAFTRLTGAYIDKGCLYKDSIKSEQNSFYWFGSDNCIYRSQGYNATKISTVALENEIMNYGQQSNVLGNIYSQAGHTFYILKFKDAGKTWCYDITTGLWHERETDNQEWLGDLIFSAWNNVYVTDNKKSILYNLDLDYGKDNKQFIKREFVFPTIKNEEIRTFHRRLEIDMDTGFSQNENLFLQYSDDGGYTWSNEYWVSLGEKAEYNRKLEWRRLGSSVARIYKIKMSTENKVNIIGAYIDIKKGTA